MDNLETAEANSQVLHGFYSSLKTNINCIRLALITGITRFALTSVDSGPNNFKDISLLSKFSGMCGFTISEFDRLFEDRMEDTLEAMRNSGNMLPGSQASDLRETILSWYDGYNWLGQERVLNPYSILNFFDEQSFELSCQDSDRKSIQYQDKHHNSKKISNTQSKSKQELRG
jgi:hypothetical protein